MSIKPVKVKALMHILAVVHLSCTLENPIVGITILSVNTMRFRIRLEILFCFNCFISSLVYVCEFRMMIQKHICMLVALMYEKSRHLRNEDSISRDQYVDI